MRSAGRQTVAATTLLLFLVGLGTAQQPGSSAPVNKAPVDVTLVTVTQLTEILREAKNSGDAESAKEIDRLQLTERLSSAKLAALSAELPGMKAKAALMAVGDVSAFLDPPQAEIPQRAVPDATKQRQIMSLAVDYLKEVLPKLPDFYAQRFTTSFEGVSTPKDEKSVHALGALHSAGEYKATVYYRGGKEVVHFEGAEEYGLFTYGTFGPILSTVIVDAARSSTQWSRWEEGPNGPMAVFRFHVPQTESHYEVSAGTLGTEGLEAMGPTAYHGEMGIDPSSGTILRLVLQADSDPGPSMLRADIMVEYGSVVIGEKTYTCPVRSVSISTGESPQARTARGPALPRELTRLDDVVFSGYHVFRSDYRIVPYVPEDARPEPKNQNAPIVQQPAIEEPVAPRLVTVAQLTEIVGKTRGRHDREAATEIEQQQLTERLSSPKLATCSDRRCGYCPSEVK